MMRSLAVVALAASAAGACVENEDIASYTPTGTQYCGLATFPWCKDVSCTGNAGTWARLGYATCEAQSSDNLCGATTSNCGSYGINKATMDCDCVPGDDDGAVMPAGCDTSSSSSSSTSTSSGSSSQTSNDDVVDDDKKMTLIVLAGLLGLSLAIAAGLFALRQQQLAAKKPRAPRTFTVTAVQGV
jgi:hypothetical protein